MEDVNPLNDDFFDWDEVVEIEEDDSDSSFSDYKEIEFYVTGEMVEDTNEYINNILQID